MLIKYWMSKPVITVEANDSMEKAVRLLKQHHISMLPVVKRGKLVGVVTNRELNQWPTFDTSVAENQEDSSLFTKVKVNEIMINNPVTVPLSYTMDEVAMVLLKNKLSGVTVVNQEGLIEGVITQTDILKEIISLTGVGKRGIQFGLEIEDRPGSITVLADIIRECGGRITSILASNDLAPDGFRRVYFRIYSIDRFKLDSLKEKLKKKATLLYMANEPDAVSRIC